MKKRLYSILLISSLLAFNACRREPEPIYEINPVSVRVFGAEKTREKSPIEFISIAYSDIFGTTIPQNTLNKINIPYLGFGDKKAIEDLIIRNFLNSNNSIIPSNSEMRSNPDFFVKNTIEKLFNRTPNEFEIWFLTDYINKTPSLTSSEFYYSVMTSEEYRFY